MAVLPLRSMYVAFFLSLLSRSRGWLQKKALHSPCYFCFWSYLFAPGFAIGAPAISLSRARAQTIHLSVKENFQLCCLVSASCHGVSFLTNTTPRRKWWVIRHMKHEYDSILRGRFDVPYVMTLSLFETPCFRHWALVGFWLVEFPILVYAWFRPCFLFFGLALAFHFDMTITGVAAG